MTVKEHYDILLADIYSWMLGDFNLKQKEFQQFLEDNGIQPTGVGRAIDLGAGHGIQTVSLAKLGFNVMAVDFNEQLLEELKNNAKGLTVETRSEDIKRLKYFVDGEYDLIICCGDTLSHLDNMMEINKLIITISVILKIGGKTILSFRDYSTELIGDDRFITVKSDDNRILTCMLEYENELVRVTDLLNEKTEIGWNQKVSSYYKVRILTNEIIEILEANGMQIQLNLVNNRVTTIIAVRNNSPKNIM